MSRLDEKGRRLNDLVCTNKEFVDELSKHFDWYSSVPDSVFKGVISLIGDEYHFSSRENHCLSMAFGAMLGGKSPCVFIQNSGIGLSIDSIIGLFELYKKGIVVFVSNRGELDWEEVQHHTWGEITIPILEAAKFTVLDFEKGELKSVKEAFRRANENNEIVFVVVHRGNLDEKD